MNNKLLYTSISLIVIGFIVTFFGNQASYIAEDGRVVDSMLIPFGALLLVVGIVLLIVFAIHFVINRLKNR